MGDLRVTIEHGSGIGSIINGKTVVIAAGVAVIASGGGASGVISGVTSLVEWIAGVMAVAVGAGAVIMIRATRHHRAKDYVRSIHGPTQRDVVLDDNARMRRQLADIRAMRRQVEAARALGLDYAPDYMSRPVEVWEAEVIG